MLTILTQIVTSFVTAAAFGIVVNVPRRVLIACGITGSLGWLMYWLCTFNGVSAGVATFLGAALVSISSIICARHYKVPTTTFNLPGIFPLVPGIAAYQAIRGFMSGDTALGLSLLIRTLTISVTIALAIVLVEVIYRMIVSRKRTRTT